MPQSSDSTSDSTPQPKGLRALGDPVVLILSIGFIIAFILLSLYDLDMVANGVSAGFAWTAVTLGSYFQLLLLATFFYRYGPCGNAGGQGQDRQSR